ncbi:MAG TPA: hypothetical protein VGH90_00960 [Chthoniobacteraceae bacterium]
MDHSAAAFPVASVDEGKEAQQNLVRTLEQYERRPTPELIAAAWEAFARIDSQLSALKRQVAESLGGARAEAEIDRIELQRWRDAQMERFSGAQRKIVSVMSALNSLSKVSPVGESNVGEMRSGESARAAGIEE